jgi:hypothetical protein
MSYLAKEFLNGFSQKAIYMYVLPLPFCSESALRNLNPFERTSKFSLDVVSSAPEEFGARVAADTL